MQATEQANSSAGLIAKGISVRFGGIEALRDVWLHVGPGEIVGLIGPNGAGKTTLVNVLAGTVRPKNGAAWFNGVRITSLRQYKIVRLGLSRTFQAPKPFRGMTVRQNLLTASYYGTGGGADLSEVEARVQGVGELVGLTSKMNHTPDRLTVADLKRMELGRALCIRPKMLLLDEVMGGLNSKEMMEAIDLCKRINALGISLLVIEHVMAAIGHLAQRVVVLNLGRKLCEGPPVEVFRNQEVIKAYLGSRFVERQLGRTVAAGQV